jgi:hypothetical protein
VGLGTALNVAIRLGSHRQGPQFGYRPVPRESESSSSDDWHSEVGHQSQRGYLSGIEYLSPQGSQPDRMSEGSFHSSQLSGENESSEAENRMREGSYHSSELSRESEPHQAENVPPPPSMRIGTYYSVNYDSVYEENGHERRQPQTTRSNVRLRDENGNKIILPPDGDSSEEWDETIRSGWRNGSLSRRRSQRSSNNPKRLSHGQRRN